MPSTQTGKEVAVSSAVDSLRKAMVAGDKAALEKLSLNELSYGHSSGRLEDKAEFIATLTNGKAGFTAIELSDQTVNVVDKVALVRHVFNGTSRKDGGHMKLSISRSGSTSRVSGSSSRGRLPNCRSYLGSSANGACDSVTRTRGGVACHVGAEAGVGGRVEQRVDPGGLRCFVTRSSAASSSAKGLPRRRRPAPRRTRRRARAAGRSSCRGPA